MADAYCNKMLWENALERGDGSSRWEPVTSASAWVSADL